MTDDTELAALLEAGDADLRLVLAAFLDAADAELRDIHAAADREADVIMRARIELDDAAPDLAVILAAVDADEHLVAAMHRPEVRSDYGEYRRHGGRASFAAWWARYSDNYTR